MHKAMFAAVLAAGLIAAPLPPVVATAAAQTAAPAKTDAKTDTTTDAKPAAKTKKPPSAGVAAMRERQKKCGAEWKAAKAAGKVEKGMKWPQFWSACNKRLKSAT